MLMSVWLQTLKAAADAYCDIFNDKSVVVPWGTPCARLEGGWYTGNGSQSDRCDIGIPSGVALVNRQYVIDEEYGYVFHFLHYCSCEPNRLTDRTIEQ